MWIGFVLWGVSASLLLFAAAKFSRYFFADFISRTLATSIFTVAMIVSSGELLSVLQRIGDASFWLAASIAFAAAAWFVPGRTFPNEPSIVERISRSSLAWRCMSAAYLGLFLIALLLPPNTWDSMSYHLSRVGYYLQYGSLNHFFTNNLRQVDFPANAEVVLLWTVVFPRCDALAGLVQFCAALGCAFSIYGVARALGLKRYFAALCPLFVLGMPEIGLQASSTQNDLFTAWLVSAAVYFAVRDARNPARSTAFLSGLSMGLAIGTKLTAGFFAPGLALLWLAVSHSKNTLALRPALRIASMLVLGAALFTGPHTLRNYSATGYAVSQERSVRVENISPHTFAANAIRLGADLCEANDWPYPLNRAFGWLKHKAAGALLGSFDFINPAEATFPGTRHEFKGNILEEDASWFGSLGFILWLGAGLGLVLCRKNKSVCFAYASLPFGFFVLTALLLRWQPWAGRFFVPASVLIVPAGVLGIRSALRPFSRGLKRIIWKSLAGLAVCGAFVVLIQNELKPLLPRAKLASIFSLTRNQQRCRHRPYNEVILTSLSEMKPARVGFVGDVDQWDYLAFVPGFKHYIMRYDSTVDIAAAFVRDKCDIILAQTNYLRVPSSPDFEVVALNDYWSLIKRRK